MKIAIISDTHFGARNDSQVVARHMELFWKDVFFPYLDAHGINTVLHLGDIMDRRKFVSYLTIQNFRRQFLDPIMARNINLDVAIGNHDTFYKNTNKLNCMQQLLEGTAYDRVKWFEGATERRYGTLDVLLIPWICADNHDETIELIKKTECKVAMGHLEIQGFEMYRGSIVSHGEDKSLFDKFHMVLSGHYHHKSSRNNIHYLGAQYEMTWSDYDDDRGFHVLDTETLELSYIKNPNRLFHKLVYDDTNKDLEYPNQFEATKFRDNYVKLIVKAKNNPYWFDIVAERLNNAGVADLQIVDDHLNLDLDNNDEIESAEDTLTIIKKFALQQTGVDHNQLVRLLGELYAESLTLEME